MASGCSICATTNQCNHAFQNGPGQYCGDWYDYNALAKKPCCCPLPQVGSAQPTTCNMTPSQCKCHIVPASQPSRYGYTYNNHQPVHSPSYYPPTAYHSNWHGNNYYYRRQDTVTPLIILLFLIICCCTCCFGNRFRHHHNHHPTTTVPIATPVGVDPSCPPPENPTYTAKPWYGSTSSSSHHNHHHGGGSGGNFASGLGGFAIGTLVGDLIGRQHHQNNNVPFFGGGFSGGGNNGGFFGGGNDGGYDIIGDSGDNTNSPYDVQGDSGGYDIQGDS